MRASDSRPRIDDRVVEPPGHDSGPPDREAPVVATPSRLPFAALRTPIGQGAVAVVCVVSLLLARRAPLNVTELSLVLLCGALLLVVLALGARTARLSGEAAGLRRQLNSVEAVTVETVEPVSVAEIEAADPQSLMERFLGLARELLPAERALVWTLDPNKGALIPSAALPDAGPFAEHTVQPGDGLIGHAAVDTKPRLLPDAARDSYRGQYETASGAWLLYPIVVAGQVLATIQWTRPTSQPFTNEDIARLDSLVRQTALALENMTIRARIQEQTSTDDLTGLWNAPYMTDLLRDEVARAARYHRALSLLLLDVDGLRTFNDTYGHPQGDHLLRGIADILRAKLRSVDHAGRFGGEEFLVVLPETGKDDAFRLAERLRQTVEEHGGVTLGGEEVVRTVSVGVAAYPEDALNATDLVERAEEALQRAKRDGKNRVTWA